MTPAISSYITERKENRWNPVLNINYNKQRQRDKNRKGRKEGRKEGRTNEQKK